MTPEHTDPHGECAAEIARVTEYISAVWEYVPSAMSLFDPGHPRASTGAIIAKVDGNWDGRLVAVVSSVDETVGRHIAKDHNAHREGKT